MAHGRARPTNSKRIPNQALTNRGHEAGSLTNNPALACKRISVGSLLNDEPISVPEQTRTTARSELTTRASLPLHTRSTRSNIDPIIYLDRDACPDEDAVTRGGESPRKKLRLDSHLPIDQCGNGSGQCTCCPEGKRCTSTWRSATAPDHAASGEHHDDPRVDSSFRQLPSPALTASQSHTDASPSAKESSSSPSSIHDETKGSGLIKGQKTEEQRLKEIKRHKSSRTGDLEILCDMVSALEKAIAKYGFTEHQLDLVRSHAPAKEYPGLRCRWQQKTIKAAMVIHAYLLGERVDSLQAGFDTLQERYETLQARHDTLQARFDAMFAEGPPHMDANGRSLSTRDTTSADTGSAHGSRRSNRRSGR